MASIVVLSDVILPNSVIAAAGLQGRNRRSNTRVRAESGFAQHNLQWTRTLRQFDIGFIPMLSSVWRSIEGLHEVTEGGVYGFLLRDPKDSEVSITEGLLQPYLSATLGTIGSGYGIPTYRLYKRISAIGTTRTKDRPITRPIASGLVVKRAGSTQTVGGGAGNYSVNVDTGTITFVADSSSAVTAVTPGATTVVTLTAALAGLAIGGRLYLSGLTGTIATTLNGLSHAITNITGGSLNVYTLSVVTTGLAWTSAGSGYKYPQSTETLTWSGDFYVPVNFASDDLPFEVVRSGVDPDERLVMGQSVMLDEVRE